MKYLRRGFLLIVSLSFLTSAAFAQREKEAALTNASVVKLARAGFKEKTIISIISARLPAFDLSPERMIELKRNGVSEKIIVAMLARQEGAEFDDSSWGDDEPFGINMDSGGKSSLPGGGNSTSSDPNGSSTNIFGSSTGSRSATRTRGGQNAGSTGDTQTVGSATVRILRPPTEAGGTAAAPKLEKVKTLTNDSIVELVEAGFSEGTIIRRIEQSPVEFDLAANKLEDLRKHRVSEKILTAMRTAMGDDSSNKPGS
jgi:hypothetical protein